MIEVKDLTKTFGGFHALSGVSFSMDRGEVVGFLGPNGAGKTTTMKILTGYLLATSGEATFDGLSIEDHALEIRRRIGYLPESAPLYSDMHVDEALRFACDMRNLPRAERGGRIGAVAERCGIRDVLKIPIGQLSKGYRQRVGLAQALLHRPELLILDEPTTGLDPNQIVEIRELLREIGREKTIILSTHILREVEATCDRILIINQGKIVADGKTQELQTSESLLVSGRGADEATARAAFCEHPAFTSVEALVATSPDTFHLRLSGKESDGAAAFELCREKGWVLSELHRERPGLEEVFHRLTGA